LSIKKYKSYQPDDIRVIRDICEVCESQPYTVVLESGHLAEHRIKIKGKGKWVQCTGGGLLALRVINILRAEKETE